MASEQGPHSRILGTGAYAPERVLTNHDLEKLVDTSDEWISERTGIKQRHIARDDETASDMALAAARRALESAGLSPADLDMIIVGTISGDVPMPACAAYLQRKLGAGPIPSFDVSAACAGFLYAMSIADQFVRSGVHKHILIVGVELLSRLVDWQDRTTCVLFGDGAGAAIIGPATGDGRGILSTRLYTDASLTESLCIPAGGSREALTAEGLIAKRDKVKMVGKDIFKAAVKNLYSASRDAVDEAGMRPDDVDWICPHQANLRIINQAVERLGVVREKVLVNIDKVGNTSSASIPILLDQSMRAGTIKEGQTVLMCALGAGISWGSALIRV